MAFQKGKPKTGGRKKGTPNKMTKDAVSMVIESLDLAGGMDYLLDLAENHKHLYISLLKQAMPKDVNVGGQENNPVITEIVLRSVKAGD